MTLAAPLSKSPRLANSDHPRFVGLAQLRSFLLHEDVAGCSARADAVLDLIGLLLRDAPASLVVKAFCRVRRLCSSVCYLAVFRLRRWMEQQIVVKTVDAGWQSLTLAFHDLKRIEQHYRRAAWEDTSIACDWNSLPVDFAWACAGDVELVLPATVAA